jgi:hypothetical protein
MTPRNTVRTIVAVVGTAALVACSPEAVVAPASATMMTASAALSARGSQVGAGTYVLSFVDNHLQPVTTLLVGGPELILAAHVADAAGNPAQRGSVSFQYCSLNGLPSNDITRADEAPSADCASGAATWTQLTSVRVDASGNAYMDFGLVRIPRTVGFRFRYLSQGSSIPNGVSAPADFTWVSGI